MFQGLQVEQNVEQNDQNGEDGFFITEAGIQEQQMKEPEASNQEETAPEIFDEDFGKMKMEIFKQKCRNILNPIEEQAAEAV